MVPGGDGSDFQGVPALGIGGDGCNGRAPKGVRTGAVLVFGAFVLRGVASAIMFALECGSWVY